MTAPPTQEQNQQGTEQFDELDPMERTIQSTLHESKELTGGEEANQQSDRPRDEQGRFVGKPETTPDGEWHVLPDAPTGTQHATEGIEAEEQQVAIPDGYVAAPALAPEKVQGFRVMDAEGEIVPPDLTFELNFRGANGEVQPRTLDLPKLVNYARMGVYNHEREQETTNIRQYNQALQGRVQEVERQAHELHQERERLLSDPDYLIKQLQQYEQQNTPEARIARADQERQLANQRAEYIEVAQLGGRFVDGEIGPAIDTMMKALPLVSQEEIAARITLLIDPYKVRTPFGTTISPQSYDAIRRAIVREVVPWAQQVHADREERQGAGAGAGPKAKVPETEKANAAVATMQARAQKARRVAATALKPVGGNGAVQGKQDQKPIRTSRDLEDAVVGRSIASMRSG